MASISLKKKLDEKLTHVIVFSSQPEPITHCTIQHRHRFQIDGDCSDDITLKLRPANALLTLSVKADSRRPSRRHLLARPAAADVKRPFDPSPPPFPAAETQAASH